VFFGDDLPERFYKMHKIDFPEADLVIVMGTSLEVKTSLCYI
jgi:NAD-dependent SIR2 family protein deacetylase